MRSLRELDEWWLSQLAAAKDEVAAVAASYQSLENAGLINRVVLQRYVCSTSGCGVLATVIRAGGMTIMRTRDYKLSPGLNARDSVESARQRRTLDGRRHWPGHTFDVGYLAEDGVAASLNCRHRLRSVEFKAVLAAVQRTDPGRPNRPIVVS